MSQPFEQCIEAAFGIQAIVSFCIFIVAVGNWGARSGCLLWAHKNQETAEWSSPET